MPSILDITLITAIIGAVCGIVGAILGVLNTWHQLQRNKIRLKIIPQYAIPLGALENIPVNFSIEVVNLSEFPVVIADIGFGLHNGNKATLSTVQDLFGRGQLPCRLEPRTSYTKYFRIGPDVLDLTKVKCAYARTQCGTVVTGKSPALKQIISSSH